ncbi:MAG: hypothetical protein C5S52_07070 [ANME-2 cluster archaeon]|nr:hypothetical protein [ANME-2 cluster archaeon]
MFCIREFHAEGCVPLIAFALYGAGLNSSFDLAVLEDSYRSDLREDEFCVFELVSDAVRVRICEAVVPVVSFEPRVSRFFSGFYATEERFECFVHPMQHILEYMRVNALIIPIFEPSVLIVER